MNPNLADLEKFYVNQICHNDAVSVFEKTTSAELQVRYNSAMERILSGNYEFQVGINSKIVKKLGPQEKRLLYLLIRLLHCEAPRNSILHLLYHDLIVLLHKDGLDDRTFFLNELSDNQFLYWFDDQLYNKKTKNEFFRRFHSTTKVLGEGEQPLRVVDLIFSQLIISYSLRPKNKPKRIQRHRGYRDHGSLGSEFSRTLKQQSSDWTLKEAEILRQGEKETLIAFISEGLN